MTQQPKKINPSPERKGLPASQAVQEQSNPQSDLSAEQKMLQTIRNLKNGGLQGYDIRQLVEDSKDLGSHLKQIGLKTNQIRKFLEAVNRLKVELALDKDKKFSTIETEVILLKPKLAYAAARQKDDRRKFSPVEPLSNVISEAIDIVYDSPDFYRLVQLIESIIAYHKAEGGE